MPGWMKHKLETRLLGEISVTSDMQMTPPLWQKAKRTKEPLDQSETGERISWLKTQHLKNLKSWHLVPSLQDGETMETVTDFIFLGCTMLQMVTAATKLKDTCSLEEKL